MGWHSLLVCLVLIQSTTVQRTEANSWGDDKLVVVHAPRSTWDHSAQRGSTYRAETLRINSKMTSFTAWMVKPSALPQPSTDNPPSQW